MAATWGDGCLGTPIDLFDKSGDRLRRGHGISLKPTQRPATAASRCALPSVRHVVAFHGHIQVNEFRERRIYGCA